MKTTRTRKLLAVLAVSVPVLLVARGIAGDTVEARASAASALSASVIDLWYLWALRHEPVPASMQVAGAEPSMNKVQQESQP